MLGSAAASASRPTCRYGIEGGSRERWARGGEAAGRSRVAGAVRGSRWDQSTARPPAFVTPKVDTPGYDAGQAGVAWVRARSGRRITPARPPSSAPPDRVPQHTESRCHDDDAHVIRQATPFEGWSTSRRTRSRRFRRSRPVSSPRCWSGILGTPAVNTSPPTPTSSPTRRPSRPRSQADRHQKAAIAQITSTPVGSDAGRSSPRSGAQRRSTPTSPRSASHQPDGGPDRGASRSSTSGSSPTSSSSTTSSRTSPRKKTKRAPSSARRRPSCRAHPRGLRHRSDVAPRDVPRRRLVHRRDLRSRLHQRLRRARQGPRRSDRPRPAGARDDPRDGRVDPGPDRHPPRRDARSRSRSSTASSSS